MILRKAYSKISLTTTPKELKGYVLLKNISEMGLSIAH